MFREKRHDVQSKIINLNHHAMATLKAEVQGKRKDGTYLVYIRVTHNRRNSYLKPPWVVMENGVVRGKKEICDTYVCQQTSKLITFRKCRMMAECVQQRTINVQ